MRSKRTFVTSLLPGHAATGAAERLQADWVTFSTGAPVVIRAASPRPAALEDPNVARSWRSMTATIAAAAVIVAALAPPADAAGRPAASPAGSAPGAAAAIAINGGASATRDADVSIAVVPPSGSASLLRLSNDGGASWVERSYTTMIAWSLVEPAAGGVDEDGPKSVTVEAGDGVGPWAPLGSDAILLDRTPPTIAGRGALSSPWLSSSDAVTTDAGTGVLRSEISLDGSHWRTLEPPAYDFYPPGIFDFREGVIGGSWATGERSYFVRAVDRVGNWSEPREFVTTVVEAYGEDDIPGVPFSLPKPAVTGQPFTIQPEWGSSSYRVPAGFVCRWRLEWLSESTFFDGPKDEHYGNVSLSRAPKDGRCEPWTFTLPHTRDLLYRWQLLILGGPDGSQSDSLTSELAGSFRATLGGTSRAIAASNLPLYYILPNRDLVPSGASVTYRLYAVGTSTLPTTGTWWACRPAVHPGGQYYPPTQQGGTSFTCPIDRAGAWVAEWTWWTKPTRYFRAEYDPVSDRRAPTVGSPAVKIRVAASPSRTNPPVTISWSGRDSGTGIARFELQRSVNGGVYRTVTLPSSRATALDTRLAAGASYRFRVRARDRAGNWSPWSYGSTVRTTMFEETSAAFSWSAGWSREAATGASGGAVRSAAAAGRSVTFRFSGRAVGWFARRGPGQGFAQVRVDGVLVSTINLEASALQPSRVVWRRSWGAAGAHTIQVRLLGTVGRPRVEVDAFQVVR